jgi:hypothetical protein
MKTGRAGLGLMIILWILTILIWTAVLLSFLNQWIDTGNEADHFQPTADHDVVRVPSDTNFYDPFSWIYLPAALRETSPVRHAITGQRKLKKLEFIPAKVTRETSAPKQVRHADFISSHRDTIYFRDRKQSNLIRRAELNNRNEEVVK